MREALVLGACKGGYILTYYGGDGEWGYHDNARVYFPGPDVRAGRQEAKETLPEGMELHDFGVYVE